MQSAPEILGPGTQGRQMSCAGNCQGEAGRRGRLEGEGGEETPRDREQGRRELGGKGATLRRCGRSVTRRPRAPGPPVHHHHHHDSASLQSRPRPGPDACPRLTPRPPTCLPAQGPPAEEVPGTPSSGEERQACKGGGFAKGAPPANTGGAPYSYLGKYFTSFL